MWLIQEYLLILWLKVYGVLQPNPPDHWESGKGGTFVLVNGLNENWAFFKYLGDELNKLGYRVVWVSTLGAAHKPIQALTKMLTQYIQSKNIDDYYLLCHSKGAIYAKQMVEMGKVSKPKHVFCIAPPFGGTRFGFLPISHIRELHPKTDIIADIQKDHGHNSLFTSIYPMIDNHILIHESSNLMNANNVKIHISGHTRILFDSRCIEAIKCCLKTI